MNHAPENRITYLARTNHRNSATLFGIRHGDRRLHMLAIGKTGSGKSHLLKIIAEQDIVAGAGIAIFDPHGDLARSIGETAERERPSDLVYIDPASPHCLWRFNPFGDVSPDNRALAAAGIVSVFKKLWTDDWGPRLEHLLRNVAFTLLETPGATFATIPELLTDRSLRLELARGLGNPVVKAFWLEEFDKYTPAMRSMVIAPLQNKVGALLTDPVLYRFFAESGEPLDLRRIMDDGRILIVNLDKGRLGEGSSTLLGSLLLSHIALAGLSRSSQPEADRQDFAVLLDEFQLFTTQAIVNMLSELRKYRISMTLATQYLGGIEPAIRDAVLGNVGTLISFRVGATDAAHLAREFGSPLQPSDFTNLPSHHVYLRLLIDGEPSRPFSAMVTESAAAL